MNDNIYYVYHWIRLDTNEPFYVGKGHGNRYKQTWWDIPTVRAIYKQFPTYSEIIENNLTEEKAFEREKYYITLYKKLGYNLINQTKGGLGALGTNWNLGRIPYNKGVPNYKIRQGNNPVARKVLCITTNKEFTNLKEAAFQYNTNNCNISACCRGKRKSAGKLNGKKLVWRYI